MAGLGESLDSWRLLFLSLPQWRSRKEMNPVGLHYYIHLASSMKAKDKKSHSFTWKLSNQDHTAYYVWPCSFPGVSSKKDSDWNTQFPLMSFFSALVFPVGLFYTFFYLSSWGASYGLSQSLQFYSTSILNAASCFGRIIPGLLADRFGALNIIFFCTILSAIVTLCSLVVNGPAGVLIIGGFYGLGES